MKKTTTRLVAAAAAVAVLGGAYAVLLTHPAEEESSDDTAYLANLDSDSVTQIAVSLRTGDKYNVQFETDDSGTSYTVSGEDSGKYDEDALSTLLTTACALSGTLVEPTCEDLSVYGLDSESATDSITITQSDGTETVLTFGTASTVLDGTYCIADDNTDVYFISSSTADTLLQTKDAYASLSVMNSYYSLSSELQALRVDTMSDGTTFAIERRDTTDLDDDEADAYTNFVITSPASCAADDNALTNGILSDLQNGLTAQSIAAQDVSDADLSKYGLDTPRASLTMTFSNEEQVLLIGDTVAADTSGSVSEELDETSGTDGVYVMQQGSSTVYVCSADCFTFLDEDWTTYRSDYLLFCAKKQIDTVDCVYGKTKHAIDLTFVPADENEEEDSDTVTGTLDGEEMDDSAIDQLYTALTTLKAVSVYDTAASGDPVLTVTIKLTDGTTHTLSFIKGGSREYIASVDDSGAVYSVSKTDFDTLLSALGEN